MSQRAYCDQPHPGDDQEADRWCEWYHRPDLPGSERREERRQAVLTPGHCRSCGAEEDVLGSCLGVCDPADYEGEGW